jgi:transposase
MELRIRAIEAHEAGEGSYATVAARFAVGEASVKRWVWRYRKQGSADPDPNRGGRRSKISGEEIAAILSHIGDANAGEITAEFNRGRRGGRRVHVSSIKRALRRHGYVVKKNVSDRSSSYVLMSR